MPGSGDSPAQVRAAILDAQFKDADRDDINYYRRRAKNVDEAVLELGCGTGRVYLELLQAGVDADSFRIGKWHY